MVTITCDGCLEELDLSLGYIGVDVYAPADDEDEDDSDPIDDEDYAYHYCSIVCLWAWTMRQVAEVTD